MNARCERSSSIFSVASRWLLVVVLVASLVLPADAAKRKKSKLPKRRPVEELINPLVGPGLSTWLVGAISWMASKDEVDRYLVLTEETDAVTFVEQFWKSRDPEPRFEANPRRELFEERLVEAEKRFREAGVAGHRSDRGTVYVLYGEPEKVEFELAEEASDPPVEEWFYAADSEVGLDGRQPQKRFRFSKVGSVTVFHRRSVSTNRSRTLRDPRRPPRRPR